MSKSISQQHIALTGANGFVGSFVVGQLLAGGARVRVLHGPPCAGREFSPANVETVHGDICDSAVIASLVRGVDTVIHLAGPPSVPASFADPVEFIRIHGAGTACLLSESVKASVERFVYVSSAQVYGKAQSEFVSEDHAIQARSPYAAAKVCGEKLVEAYQSAFGIETVVLRPFSIYGRGSSPDAVMNKIIGMVRSGGPVVLYDLRPVLDYCFVEDVARAFVQACVAPVTGQTFNVGTMRGTSIQELALAVINLLGRSTELIEDSERRRPGSSDVLRLVADNRRAADRLEWVPSKSLEEGLNLTLHAF